MTVPPAPEARLIRIRQAGLAWRRAGDEVVILDLAASGYHALNVSGALLWERLADWTTAGELAGMLADAFGLPPATAGRDVREFLGGCARAGLLDVQTAGPGRRAANGGGPPPGG